MADKALCSIPECINVAVAKGVCHGHRHQLKKYGTTKPLRPTKKHFRPTCSVDQCNERAVEDDANSGLCLLHLRRMRRSGSIEPKIADDGAPAAFIESAMKAETDDCIIWPFGLAKTGYGVARIGRGRAYVHRHICERTNGAPQTGMYACHSCGVRPCVNPRHIRWDTPLANNLDMDTHGTRNTIKLTAAEVMTIRQSWESADELAARFKINRTTVYRLRKAKRWCGIDLL